MSFQSWVFWDERRMRSDMLCSRALMAGFSAPAWAESTASRESWDEDDERATEDIGKS
jgi:hypothetical protein